MDYYEEYSDYKRIYHREIDKMIDESFNSESGKYSEVKMIMAFGAIRFCCRLKLIPDDYADRVRDQILGIMKNQFEEKFK